MMSLTRDLKLPTYDKLQCPVVNVSSPALRAGTFHIVICSLKLVN